VNVICEAVESEPTTCARSDFDADAGPPARFLIGCFAAEKGPPARFLIGCFAAEKGPPARFLIGCKAGWTVNKFRVFHRGRREQPTCGID